MRSAALVTWRAARSGIKVHTERDTACGAGQVCIVTPASTPAYEALAAAGGRCSSPVWACEGGKGRVIYCLQRGEQISVHSAQISFHVRQAGRIWGAMGRSRGAFRAMASPKAALSC